VVIYEAFVEGKLEVPEHLARTVHDLYFEPKYEEFQACTIWSLSKFKELDPIPRIQGDSQTGPISGRAVRTVVLSYRRRLPGGQRPLPVLSQRLTPQTSVVSKRLSHTIPKASAPALNVRVLSSGRNRAERSHWAQTDPLVVSRAYRLT
jgi:hypothetical protein